MLTIRMAQQHTDEQIERINALGLFVIPELSVCSYVYFNTTAEDSITAWGKLYSGGSPGI